MKIMKFLLILGGVLFLFVCGLGARLAIENHQAEVAMQSAIAKRLHDGDEILRQEALRPSVARKDKP